VRFGCGHAMRSWRTSPNSKRTTALTSPPRNAAINSMATSKIRVPLLHRHIRSRSQTSVTILVNRNRHWSGTSRSSSSTRRNQPRVADHRPIDNHVTCAYNSRLATRRKDRLLRADDIARGRGGFVLRLRRGRALRRRAMTTDPRQCSPRCLVGCVGALAGHTRSTIDVAAGALVLITRTAPGHDSI
jgi:hypothetical protein